ncbi:MAG: aminotransferase class V-fold PLP-dependent enzyme [Pseudomonadota bacterium]
MNTSDARSLFALDDHIYLLNHSIGKMPRSALTYTQAHFFDHWQHQTPEAWPLWLSEISEFQNALASMFNSQASAFCPQTNVSSGLSKVLEALPEKAGADVILCTENDFPSAGFVLKMAERLGFQVRMLQKHLDAQDPNVWADALGNDVHSVFITHVHYNTNKLVPVADICKLARDRGITSMVDTAQSSGVVPIDLQAWDADVVFGSCIKWLCGGPGAGFLWVNPDLLDQLQPRDVGWFSHRDPFEFDIHNFEYATNANRFWGGTPSVLPYVIATNSIRLMDNFGVANIRHHNQQLSQILLEAIEPRFFSSPTDLALKGGTTVIKFAEQERVESALTEAGVEFDAREHGIRLSPHIYNTEEELRQVAECLAQSI